MARQGLYNNKIKVPTVLGFEGAGDVIEVGGSVETIEVSGNLFCMLTSGQVVINVKGIHEIL